MSVLGITLAVDAAFQPTLLERELIIRGFTPAQARAEIKRPEFRVPMMPVVEERISWDEFERRLLSPESVEWGMEYLKKNELILTASSIRFGVAPEGLVALARVESKLEKNLGDYEIYKLIFKRANRPGKWQLLWATRFAALAA